MTTLELPPTITERTVPALLDARADQIGHRTALIAHSLVSGGERRMTYAELRDAADRLAGVLAAAGVKRGDRVGILLDNDGAIEAHVTYHASHRLGAINVPLNTRYVERELAEVLAFAAPAAIVFAPKFAELLGRLRGVARRRALFEATAAEPRLGGSLAAALAAATPIAERVDGRRARRSRLDPDLGYDRQSQGGRARTRRLGRLRSPGGPGLGRRRRQRLHVVRAVLHEHRLPHQPAGVSGRRLHAT